MYHKPYSTPGFNNLYNMLFADDPLLFQNNSGIDSLYPWNILTDKNADIIRLRQIAADPGLESRARMMAYNMLRSKGYRVDSKEILGIIVEVGLAGGLDVVAAYKDGTARYINHAEKTIVWETITNQSQDLVKRFFSAGLQVVKNIGPWTKERLSHPGSNEVRISFLVADGLYFGQGPFDAMQQDKMGGPVIHAAMQLMLFLIDSHHPVAAEN